MPFLLLLWFIGVAPRRAALCPCLLFAGPDGLSGRVAKYDRQGFDPPFYPLVYSLSRSALPVFALLKDFSLLPSGCFSLFPHLSFMV